MGLKDKSPYLIIGLAMIVASVNPFSLMLTNQLEMARVSFDMVLVWGAGLIGIWLADYMYRKGIGRSFLSFNFTTKGLVLAWLIGGSIVTFWYFPEPFDLSVENMLMRAIQIVSFIVAGIFGGLGWFGMTTVWKSVTIFSAFTMMASMAEIFLEMGTYYSTNLYPAYDISQFVDTAYFLFAMAFVPSTYYMIKWLKDLGLF